QELDALNNSMPYVLPDGRKVICAPTDKPADIIEETTDHFTDPERLQPFLEALISTAKSFITQTGKKQIKLEWRVVDE
ncbi:hypothetical protein ACFL04_00480, partial [Patescibacteria group bacterium]